MSERSPFSSLGFWLVQKPSTKFSELSGFFMEKEKPKESFNGMCLSGSRKDAIKVKLAIEKKKQLKLRTIGKIR